MRGLRPRRFASPAVFFIVLPRKSLHFYLDTATFLHITRLLLVFLQQNIVVGQLFCQLYTTVITMKCLSNNQTLNYYMQYAFCDEFGAFGFTFEKPNVSTHFIITAIIVNDSDMPALRDSVEAVRKNIFRQER